MNIEKPILGVDVSKVKFDVCLIYNGKERRRKFNNSASGFQQLSEFVEKQGIVSIYACMEATGRYYEDLAQYLYAAGHLVSVVNPLRIKGFAVSELKRSKTDEIDAGIIARFARCHCPSAWKPQPPEVRELQEAERYLVSLKSNVRQELNRLESGITCEMVRSTIQQHIADLESKIQEIEVWMKQHTKKHDRLNRQYKLITSIIGIGDIAAFTYLGELGYSDNFSRTREVESYSGLTPRTNQSGSSIHGKARLSKIGNVHLRTALYMPAMSAMRHNPIIRTFAERLKQAGKPPKVIICAVMRKLLRIIFAIAKSGQTFDPEYRSHSKTELTTLSAVACM